MAGPITWRNVGATVSPGNSAALAASGNTGIQQVLGSIGDVIAGQQKVALANSKVARENSTQDYLDQVGSASLEQLQDPQFASTLTSQAASPESGIDRNVARGAIDKRISDLQKSAVTQQAFADVQQGVAERQLTDELYGAAASGNTAKVAEILDNNQLMNEGKLRTEVTSMTDALQQRQYRAAGEQRAEAAADRAVESHDLSQRVGMANLDWTNEQRGELKQKRDEFKLADSAALKTANDFTEARKGANEFLNNLGKDLGLPTGEDGLPDQSKMTPDERSTYAQAVRDSGIQANLSDTDERNALVESMRGTSPEAQDRAIKQLGVEQSLRQLTATDRAKVESTVAATNAGLDRVIKQKTEDFEREAGRNVFLEPSKTPVDDVNKALSSLQKADFGTAQDRQMISNQLIDFATNGIKMPDGSVVPVPTAVINNAVSTAPTGFLWDSEDAVKDRILDLMTSEGLTAQRQAAPDMRKNFVTELNDLQNQKLSNAVKVTRSAEAQRGVTINPNDVLTNVLKRRE